MPELTVTRTKTFTRLSWRARFRLWWRRWRMPPEIAALEDELARREMDALINGTSGHPAANPGALPPSPTRRP